ncbi:MAG: hypothetical protein LC777_12550, partial [Actinobacteria bacterium]|nr:hypothetical protein [Actinomycetota bacterium]
VLLNVALHGMEQAAGVRYYTTSRAAGWTVAGSPVLIRYADLCGDPHRSAYAETRVMPSDSRNPCLAAGIGWKCSA